MGNHDPKSENLFEEFGKKIQRPTYTTIAATVKRVTATETAAATSRSMVKDTMSLSSTIACHVCVRSWFSFLLEEGGKLNQGRNQEEDMRFRACNSRFSCVRLDLIGSPSV